jgi:Domain of unknown function (DUF4145)
MATFVVDCPYCKAKVGVQETGHSTNTGLDDGGAPYGEKISIGNCPRCRTALVGQSIQVHFEGVDSDEDTWSDMVRVFFPNPPKTFSSYQIPKVARSSLEEADRCIQANANSAACVMFGRTLEAVCTSKLLTREEITAGKRIMLGNGIKQLREKEITSF